LKVLILFEFYVRPWERGSCRTPSDAQTAPRVVRGPFKEKKQRVLGGL
jgi:hypothetical protein